MYKPDTFHNGADAKNRAVVRDENGAGGNRTPKHPRNLPENTPIPTGAQRQAQRRPHRGPNGAQSRPRRGRWQVAATPRPTPTWPASWRRGPTCPPTCVPGSSRRCGRPRPPADHARRPTEPTKPAMPRRGGASPSVLSAATSAWFLPAAGSDVTPAGTAAITDRVCCSCPSANPGHAPTFAPSPHSGQTAKSRRS